MPARPIRMPHWEYAPNIAVAPQTYTEALERRRLMERAAEEYYRLYLSCPSDGCLSNGWTFGEMALYLLKQDEIDEQRNALERRLSHSQGQLAAQQAIR